MLTTEHAILRARRDLTLGTVIKAALLAAVIASIVVLPVVAPQVNVSLALLLVGGVWLVLGYNSAKGSRLAADAPLLIAAGRFDEAEEQLGQAIHSFSLFRHVKLQTLLHLANLRHAQKQFGDVAALGREILAQRGVDKLPMSRAARLITADALLETGDLRGAYDALSGLYGQRLALAEVLRLLAAQVDYEARVGAWSRMMNAVMTKVQLAELMPSGLSAQTQAFLALAARNAGRQDFCHWLRGRAELLTDRDAIVARRPMLADVWVEPAPTIETPAATATDPASSPLPPDGAA